MAYLRETLPDWAKVISIEVVGSVVELELGESKSPFKRPVVRSRANEVANAGIFMKICETCGWTNP
jgi:hypothetical protein